MGRFHIRLSPSNTIKRMMVTAKPGLLPGDQGNQMKPISGGICSVIRFGPQTKEEVRKSLQLYIYLRGIGSHLSTYIRAIIVVSYYIGSKQLVHEPIVQWRWVHTRLVVVNLEASDPHCYLTGTARGLHKGAYKSQDKHLVRLGTFLAAFSSQSSSAS